MKLKALSMDKIVILLKLGYFENFRYYIDEKFVARGEKAIHSIGKQMIHFRRSYRLRGIINTLLLKGCDRECAAAMNITIDYQCRLVNYLAPRIQAGPVQTP